MSLLELNIRLRQLLPDARIEVRPRLDDFTDHDREPDQIVDISLQFSIRQVFTDEYLKDSDVVHFIAANLAAMLAESLENEAANIDDRILNA